MNLFGFLRRPEARSSAQTAKDRLQIILAHERQDRAQPDYLPRLQRDILDVIRNYADVASDKVQMRLQRGERISRLEIEIELPAARVRTIDGPAASPSAVLAR
ncbi:MAG TPA: cell division topological specificity factor MinE [Stellaceae bacterium]|nr:cell division topological specificity factor MinE [Stellaceae bacterium]